jgi:hypothetical protein
MGRKYGTEFGHCSFQLVRVGLNDFFTVGSIGSVNILLSFSSSNSVHGVILRKRGSVTSSYNREPDWIYPPRRFGMELPPDAVALTPASYGVGRNACNACGLLEC